MSSVSKDAPDIEVSASLVSRDAPDIEVTASFLANCVCLRFFASILYDAVESRYVIMFCVSWNNVGVLTCRHCVVSE